MVFGRKKRKLQLDDRPIFSDVARELGAAERFPRARRNVRRAASQAKRPLSFVGMSLSRDLGEIRQEFRKKKPKRRKRR